MSHIGPQYFKGGICACMTSGPMRRLKKRYLSQAKAKADAQNMTPETWVYTCPSERGVWHVTTHAIEGSTYIAHFEAR